MKITIIAFVVLLIIPLLSALMSRPNSRVQKISLEIFRGILGFAIIVSLLYWFVTSYVF